MQKTTKKKYVLDTNIILEDFRANLKRLNDNGDNDIYITDIVLSELDKIKISFDKNLAFIARDFIRCLEIHEEVTSLKIDTVQLPNIKIFKASLLIDKDESIDLFIATKPSNLYKHSDGLSNDYKIMEMAKDIGATIITMDGMLKITAKMNNVNAENFKFNETKSPNEIVFFFSYKIEEDEIDKKLESLKGVIKKYNQLEFILLKDGVELGKKLYYISNGFGFNRIRTEENDFSKYVVKPKNIGQKFYIELLESPASLIVVRGATGSGKTILALQEGIKRVRDKNSKIDKIIFLRYTINTNEKIAELGFRGGDEDEKLGHYNLPLYSNIAFYMEKEYEMNNKGTKSNNEKQSFNDPEKINAFIKEHSIEILDIAHIRGHNIRNAFVIYDEVQNSPTFITRLVGTRLQDSVMVSLGDINQIDHPNLTINRNSLSKFLELAESGDDELAAIVLPKTVRSKEAEWFEKNMK